MSFQISDLNNEGMYAMILSLRDKSCIQYNVIWSFTQTTWPELSRFQARWIDYKFFSVDVIGCGSL